MNRRVRGLLGILLGLAFLVQMCAPAAASTVGTISGVVTDASSGKALADVAVAAVSPSGTYRAVTDARGFYAMAGVSSDTYALSFQIRDYEPVSETGVNVAPDQVSTVNVQMRRSLKTIAEVRVRSAGGAFQPHQTADTYTVTPAQISTIQGSPLNISEKSLLTALPGVQYSSGNYPTIRGGRTNNVDYEFEGMNYTDPYTQRNINGFNFPAFGLASVQLSPGSENETFGNSGVGTVNVTARRGTYPGTADAALGVGGPGFFHSADFGYGIATPNGRWSEYLSYTAHNDAPRYGGTYWTDNANDIGVENFPMYLTDRELLSNTVYKWGRNDKFGLQLLINTGLHETDGGYGDALSRNLCYFSCDPNQINAFAAGPGNYPNGAGYAGVVDFNGNPHGLTVQQIQSLLVFSPGQTQTYQLLGGSPEYSEHGISNGSKLQFTWNPDSSTYIYAGADTTNGATTSDSPNSALYRVIGGYNAEFNAGMTKQLSEKNLLRLNVHTLRERPLNEGLFPNDELFNIVPAFGVSSGELYDFISPSDPNCPLGSDPSGNSYCGHLYKALNITGPTGTLKLIPGGAGTRITGSSFDYSVGDSWTPNQRLKIDAGVRIENHRYHLPPYGQTARLHLVLHPGRVCDAFARRIAGRRNGRIRQR